MVAFMFDKPAVKYIAVNYTAEAFEREGDFTIIVSSIASEGKSISIASKVIKNTTKSFCLE